jgi:hypothetical protein
MKLIDYCVIRPNNVLFKTGDLNFDSVNNPKDLIKDFIEIKKTESENFMEDVILSLNIPSDISIDTIIIKQDKNYVYELCLCYTYDFNLTNTNIKQINDKIKSFGTNGIGFHLTKKKYNVFGNCILLKSKIREDDTTEIDSITLDDVFSLYRNNFISKACKIDNNEIKEIEFIHHPIEAELNILNYRFYEMIYLGNIFMIFIQINPEQNYINEVASILKADKYPVIGNTVISMRKQFMDIRDTEFEYLDIDKNHLEMLVKLILSGLSSEVEKTVQEKAKDLESSENKSGLTKISNFYLGLDKKYYSIKFKDLKKLNNSLVIDKLDRSQSVNDIIKKKLTEK